MKRTLFALSLLVSAAAQSAVKLEIAARCGIHDHRVNHVFFNPGTNSQLHLDHDGILAILTLKEEAADHAVVTLEMAKKSEAGEVALGEAQDITLTYGEATTITCPHEGVDGQATLTATQVDC